MLSKIVKIENLYVMLLASVAFTIPFPMLLNNIAIIILCLFWLFLCFKKLVVKPSFRSLVLLSIPYSIVLLGAVNSSDYEQLLTELTKSLPFLIFPLIMLTIPTKLTEMQLKKILKAFVLGTVFIGLFLLAVIIFQVMTNGLTLETLWSLTHQSLSEYVHINAIYLSMYIGLALMILVYSFQPNIEDSLFKNYFLNLVFMGVLLIILIFLSSRTVLLTIGILLAIIFFKKRLRNESIFKVTVRFLLLSSVLVIGIMYINPVLKWRMESVFGIQDTQFTVGKEEGIKMRQKLWSSSIEVFENNWLIGVGSGDFKHELEKIYRYNEYRIQYRHQMNSHNQYLSYLVSNGIVGLLLFLIYLISPVKNYIKHRFWLMVFISILFAVCCLTESYLYTNKGVIVIAFFVSLMYIYSKNSSNCANLQNNSGN